MHQQTHCLTLPKPFFQIFLFRIYAPTVQTHPHHIDPVFAETSVSGSTNIHTHTATQTNPPTTLPTHSTNTTTIQTHNNTATHATPGPPTLTTLTTLTPTHSTQTLTQPPLVPYLATGQARHQTGSGHALEIEQAKYRIRLDQTRPDQASNRPRTRQARYRTGQVQDQTGPDQTRLNQTRTGTNSTGQAPDRPNTGSGQIRSDQTKPDQTKSDQTRPVQDIDTAFAGTSRPVSANFSARPDSRLIRDAMRSAPMPSQSLQVPACWQADCWPKV